MRVCVSVSVSVRACLWMCVDKGKGKIIHRTKGGRDGVKEIRQRNRDGEGERVSD